MPRHAHLNSSPDFLQMIIRFDNRTNKTAEIYIVDDIVLVAVVFPYPFLVMQ